MLWRAAVILVGVSFVAYRVAMWLEIRKAKKGGDVAREERLRSHGFGLYRWIVLCLLLFIIVLSLLIWSNAR
jgi:hypothetical protein